MPKHHKPPPPLPAPVQLPLFAETASLVRICDELNQWRYDPMEIWPDLFSRALLSTTAVYANAVRAEKDIARRIWG